ncbi:MAG: hypothetical protein ACRELD_08200 [Longimicrobiales bacterium]
MSQVLALRELLEQRFPGALPLSVGGTAEPVSTGVAVLDRLLPQNGLPRARLTLWRPGGGATAVLRESCARVVARGERAAWIDAAGLVTGSFWKDGPLLVRPPGVVSALGCAEELLRSGGFALVVLALGEASRSASGTHGLEAVRRGAADAAFVRLSRGAREGGGALVLVAPHSPVAALRLVSRITSDGYEWDSGPLAEPAQVAWVRMRVKATSPGWSGHTEFRLAVAHPDPRLALESALPDRRGVAAVKRRRWRR